MAAWARADMDPKDPGSQGYSGPAAPSTPASDSVLAAFTAEEIAAMDAEDKEFAAAYDLACQQADAKWNAATPAKHYLTVLLHNQAGAEFRLTCEGDRDSRCHLHQIQEDGPELEATDDCNTLDWFNDDRETFVMEGYAGPDRDGIVSGYIRIITLTEDTIEWEYAQ